MSLLPSFISSSLLPSALTIVVLFILSCNSCPDRINASFLSRSAWFSPANCLFSSMSRCCASMSFLSLTSISDNMMLVSAIRYSDLELCHKNSKKFPMQGLFFQKKPWVFVKYLIFNYIFISQTTSPLFEKVLSLPPNCLSDETNGYCYASCYATGNCLFPQ